MQQKFYDYNESCLFFENKKPDILRFGLLMLIVNEIFDNNVDRATIVEFNSINAITGRIIDQELSSGDLAFGLAAPERMIMVDLEDSGAIGKHGQSRHLASATSRNPNH